MTFATELLRILVGLGLTLSGLDLATAHTISSNTLQERTMPPDAFPPIGLSHSRSLAVDGGLTVPELSPALGTFGDMPAVFATAYMIARAEAACIEAIAPYLGEQQGTVGTHVDMSHKAATPLGMRVTAEIELVAIEGRRLRFRVECRDDAEVIGSGFHERAVVNLPKFTARVEVKRCVHG